MQMGEGEDSGWETEEGEHSGEEVDAGKDQTAKVNPEAKQEPAVRS